MTRMANRLNRKTVTDERHGYLSSFIDGYFMPCTVQVRLMAQEPLLEYAPSEASYVRNAWHDAMDALNSAMVQYAEEN